MADKYSVGASPSQEKKHVQITRSWSESREELFTIADLERQMEDCDNQIKYATDRKAELEAKIKEAEKAIG